MCRASSQKGVPRSQIAISSLPMTAWRRLRPCACIVWLLVQPGRSLSVASRREVVVAAIVSLSIDTAIDTAIDTGATGRPTNQSHLSHFEYTPNWTGTALEVLAVESSARTSGSSWEMGRWPDPILRRPASTVDEAWFDTSTLQSVAQRLQNTAIESKAVGLAAQQCGVDARMVYLESPRPMIMVNPLIVERSPELDVRVWSEECLVLPPTFVATLLRDDWIIVNYHDISGRPHAIKLRGEAARACQHEMDHDQGILTLDHVELQDMESDTMRDIERIGHEERQETAFARSIARL